MMNSLSASTEGLAIVDQARRRRGWTKTNTARWWQEAHTSRATLRRFWQGDRIQREIFIALCQTVGIDDWQSIAQLPEVSDPAPVSHPFPALPRFDWHQAPDLESFYGRIPELQQLEQWLVVERCKLVTLTGVAGIGKTALVLAFADRMQQNFEVLIWRSLQTAPSLGQLLDSLVNGLSTHPVPAAVNTVQPSVQNDIQAVLSQLIQTFQQYRCLLVLDGWEAVMHHSESHQDYGRLLERLQSDRHQSHVLITSREPLTPVAGSRLVQSLTLRGLQRPDAVELLQAQGFTGKEPGIGLLLQLYSGNPLALKLIAPLIQSVFGGKVAAFLSQNAIVVGDRLRAAFKQQFNQLTALERDIAYWLAIWQEPISFCRLQTHFLRPLDPARVLEAIAALERRSLLEKVFVTDEPALTLQPLIKKVITDELIEQATQEICRAALDQNIGHFKVLRTHWLLRPGTDDIAGDRMLTQLQTHLEQMQWQAQGCTLDQILTQILQTLEDQPPLAIGYLGCNLMALLKRL